jgi:class 3 adenylate cyclase
MTGQKIMAIFGFCDIRNFVDTTEVLETDVMVFVNQIAEIVHSQVDKYLGAANKNIGEAFLLVWKFPEELLLRDNNGDLHVD